MYDFIIQNSHVIDCAAEIDEPMDIAIQDGMIAATGKLDAARARQIVDAAGCYVTPGLIDYHAHVNYGSSDNSFKAELGCFPSGVTTVVDGGTCGVAGYENFYRTVVQGSMLTVKAHLCISSVGQTAHLFPEVADPSRYEETKILACCARYRDNIVGLKLRLGAPMVCDHGIEALRAAAAIARKAGLRLTVHMIDCPLPVKEVLRELAAGDIFCHAFHNTGGGTILDRNGKILPEIREAKERGILFDVAHGRGGASLRVARAALEQGFWPDLITSDLSRFSLYQMPAHSLGYIMSEYLNLGFTFRELVKRYTQVPAALLYGKAGPCIAPGLPADLAVFRIFERKTRFTDYLHDTLDADRLIKCEMTVKRGEPVFRQVDFF